MDEFSLHPISQIADMRSEVEFSYESHNQVSYLLTDIEGIITSLHSDRVVGTSFSLSKNSFGFIGALYWSIPISYQGYVNKEMCSKVV